MKNAVAKDTMKGTEVTLWAWHHEYDAAVFWLDILLRALAVGDFYAATKALERVQMWANTREYGEKL